MSIRRLLSLALAAAIALNGSYAGIPPPASDSNTTSINIGGESLSVKVSGTPQFMDLGTHQSWVEIQIARPAARPAFGRRAPQPEALVTYTERSGDGNSMFSVRTRSDSLGFHAPVDAFGNPSVLEGTLEINGISFPPDQQVDGEIPLNDPVGFIDALTTLDHVLVVMNGPAMISMDNGGAVMASGFGCSLLCSGCMVSGYKWVRGFAALAACVGSAGLGCALWAASEHIVYSIAGGLACAACADCMAGHGGTVEGPPFQPGPGGICPQGSHQCQGNLCCADNPVTCATGFEPCFQNPAFCCRSNTNTQCGPGWHICGVEMCCPNVH